ncbi:hypothetical protein EUGRSUZ_A00267 [Eucalyptus grandis]|uniref:Uncharacterized protein n=2 Tax=Eucalyptus grandis TaxID=71139 RepID=A0ACC3LYQ2_EUCGR|nr:hypothetical protein EUGRSUZ_A00267 [Eucalyptus grandis]
MGTPNAVGDWSSEMEVNAFRRLFPLRYYERHLSESIRPDARPLKKARDTIVSLGTVASSDGSALAKIGSTTMLAAIKMEVMTPFVDSPDGGRIAVEFHMPSICYPVVRPGGPAEVAPVISKQLFDSLLRHVKLVNSGMIDLKELSLIRRKAAWMAYLVILHARSVSAFSHLHIPVVSSNDEGRMVMVSEELEGEKLDKEPSIMETFMTMVLNSSGRLVSLYKPGGPVLAHTSAIQEGVALMRQRMKELQEIIDEAISTMEID